MHFVDASEFMHLWQSRVEIKHSVVHFDRITTFGTELPLRTGLICMYCVNVVSIHEFTQWNNVQFLPGTATFMKYVKVFP